MPGGILVDVRESHEFISGHIPDAVNVPLSAI
ncbi:MAG: rhodanese-like domain-containing protein, partial [Oscillospiraceae bacterium]|nr:rhodanese-like domain-containing protein [Oscillospiraceae bacterium]